jgi:SAM-dependent methyltransferase
MLTAASYRSGLRATVQESQRSGRGTIRRMSGMIERYDRLAEGYLRCWAPVHAPASLRMLDRLEQLDEGLRAGESRDVLDLGCGTGNVLLEATRRWAGASLVGLDASRGMLGVARREAGALPDGDASRISFVEADAAAIPFPDAAFDVVVSAFLVQLVPDRAAVLREIRRVLRPGGIVGIAGWLVDDRPYLPEEALEAALEETGVERRERDDGRSGDFASPDSAARELRRAGFRSVAARPDELEHDWTPESYVEYRRASRDRDLLESLDAGTRDRLLSSFERRLRRLQPADFVFRPATVLIVARRP